MKNIKIFLILMILISLSISGCFLKNLANSTLPDMNTNEDDNGEIISGNTTGNTGNSVETGQGNEISQLLVSGDYMQQEILVKLTHSADINKIAGEVNGEVLELLPNISVVRILLPADLNIPDAIKILNKNKLVEYAEPNGQCSMDIVPNDSDYNRQWAPQLTGSETAWDTVTGSGVIIAITDTGVDGTHEDLVGRVKAGRDTFLNADIPAGADSSIQSHGTHCAGIAAATGDNGKGIAGVAWDSDIMPVQMSRHDDPGYATWADMAEAFIWAADHGADIISCSFGGKFYSQTMKDAIDYAVVSGGSTMFASMGNSSMNEIHYPAGYQSVIAVGATNAHDEIADFSTTGNHMSICAPGVEIYSTVPGGGYYYMSGTSMACPFVAGVAALLLSNDFSLSQYEIKTRLENSAVDLGITGFDVTYGHGRVDASAAINNTDNSVYGTVDVSVTDKLSHPVSGASVILWQEDTAISTTNSNSNGHAIFEYIPVGNYGISVSFPGFEPCLAEDNPVNVSNDGNVSEKYIAFSTAMIPFTDAQAITYQSTSSSMAMFQEKIDQLAAQGEIQDSYQLNELTPTSKGVTEKVIDVDWHSYPDATVYKVYRSVNGESYSMVFQEEPTTIYNWYGFYDYDVSEGNTYTYYVIAYGSDWETDPSPTVTIDTWLPPCSLVSPADESIITDPEPTFTWNPVGLTAGDFPYGSIDSAYSYLDVWNISTNEPCWWLYKGDLTSSTAIYNEDNSGEPLQVFNPYSWTITTYGHDMMNEDLIALSFSEYWEFIYSGGETAGVTNIEAETETYVSESMMMQYSSEIQYEWPGEGYFFNEPEPTKAEVNYDIEISWQGFCEASGYGFRIYRSINGVEPFEVIAEGTVPIGYSWYGYYDNEAAPGNSYAYYVTAYGPDWESVPSDTVTRDTWLPPCSLVSPVDSSPITDPTPTFTWDPGIDSNEFPYNAVIVDGNSCVLVYDDTLSEINWIYCNNSVDVATAIYNQDGGAIPLENGHQYGWHAWTSGYDENWERIAVSESIDWFFDYSEK